MSRERICRYTVRIGRQAYFIGEKCSGRGVRSPRHASEKGRSMSNTPIQLGPVSTDIKIEDFERPRDRQRVHLFWAGQERSRSWMLLWLAGRSRDYWSCSGDNDGPSIISHATKGASYGVGFFLPLVAITFAMAFVITVRAVSALVGQRPGDHGRTRQRTSEQFLRRHRHDSSGARRMFFGITTVFPHLLPS